MFVSLVLQYYEKNITFANIVLTNIEKPNENI